MFEDVLICYWKSLSGSWISVTNVRSKILGTLAATCHLRGEIMTELVSLYYWNSPRAETYTDGAKST